MLSVLARKTTGWLIRHDAIDEEDRELYEYAAYNLMFTSIPLTIFIVVCLCMGYVVNGLVLLVVTLSIRRYAGGYHAKTPQRCVVISSGMLTACLSLSIVMPNHLLISGAVLASAVCLCMFSPVDSENRRLDEEETQSCRYKARCMTCFWCLIYLVLSIIGQGELAVCVCLGIVVPAIMQMVCIGRFSKKHNKNE